MQQTDANSTTDSDYNTSVARDDDTPVFIDIIIIFIAGSVVSCVGIWSNIYSMVIICKLGLKDSMSVELFALSFTDLLVAAIQLLSCVCYIVGIFYPDGYIDIFSLTTLVCGYTMGCVYFISCWITTLISVERCLCVVYPFKVKLIFTRFRCICLVLLIYSIFILIHVPVYVIFKVQWMELTTTFAPENITEASLWLLTVKTNDQTVLFEETYDLCITVTMTMVIQVIVVVCALWMGYSLRVSSRVRQVNTNHVSPAENPKGYHPLSTKLASNLSPREKRLVKVVLLLAILVIVGNVPKFVIAAVYHVILPGMDALRQQYLSTVLWAGSNLCIAIGSSTNFLVYLNLNSSYNAQFYQLCHIRRRTI